VVGGSGSILGWIPLILVAFVVLCVIKYISVTATRGSANDEDKEKGR
jgi:hypothetical protein